MEWIFPTKQTDLPDCRASGVWRWHTDHGRSCTDRWSEACAWWETKWRSFPPCCWAGVTEMSWRRCPVPSPCAKARRTNLPPPYWWASWCCRTWPAGSEIAWAKTPAQEWRSWACRRLSPASGVWTASPKSAWKIESSLAGLGEWSRNSLQGLLADRLACGMHCHDSGQRSLENEPGRLSLWQPAGQHD